MIHIEEKIRLFLKNEEHVVCANTDRFFRTLLILEWLTGIFVAYYISPKTWIGTQSQVHVHLIAAIFLGALIVSVPVILVTIKPGKRITRYSVSCSQILFGCLLIHLMGGRIEAHFYLFGSLAFLATYRDWKVLIPATIITTADHILRGVYWPQSIYGVISGAEWRWVEHAFWITFEDVFLVISIIQGRKEMKKAALSSVRLELKNAEIERMNQNLSNEVEKRTKEARENASLAYHNSKLASIGALAAGVGHEINNPLTIIQGNLRLIQKNLPKESENNSKIIRSFDKTQIAVGRVADIVMGLRTFARTDNEDETTFNLEESLEQTVMLIRDIYEKEGVAVNVKTGDQELYVHGNSGKIQQVFMNLISNAKDALENVEKPAITIELSKNKDGVLTTIQDNGHGMEKEVQVKVFDAFFTTKPIGKGTGIGLSLSHSIIQEHSGTINFESNPQGTSFFVQLPLAEKVIENHINELPKSENNLWKGKRVLVIDDEEMVREVIREFLDEENCHVTEASSGAEALELLSQGHEFEVIFCDMQMPKMNGADTINKIKDLSLKYTPKFVIVTGGIDEKTLGSIDERGGTTSRLLKPFTQEKLHELLTEIFTP